MGGLATLTISHTGWTLTLAQASHLSLTAHWSGIGTCLRLATQSPSRNLWS